MPVWEGEFARGCKMATSGDVTAATGGRESGLSEGGSGLEPLPGAPAGGPERSRKKPRVDAGRVCPGG